MRRLLGKKLQSLVCGELYLINACWFSWIISIISIDYFADIVGSILYLIVNDHKDNADQESAPIPEEEPGTDPATGLLKFWFPVLINYRYSLWLFELTGSPM